jgi:predicted RNA-binding Zn-ribbon protein involved in translation (DUF1610 family)
MIRQAWGNGQRDTVRCPHCGWDNWRTRVPPGEVVVLMSCHRCGATVILRPDILARWRRARAARGEREEKHDVNDRGAAGG